MDEPIPNFAEFIDEDGKDIMEEYINDNYYQIKADIKQLVVDELERIEKTLIYKN